MQQRLIDANELLKDKVSNAYISRFDIENAPTIDAVPVVRCKNCRFGTQSKQEPKDHFVRCIHNPFYPEHFHKNHYCGFGAKKDKEAENK